MAGVHQEVWTGTVEKIFRDEMAGSHFAGIQDMSSRVATVGGAKIIHLVSQEADPEVLIDNTTYPIEIVASADGDITITLKKLDTKNTPITRDELQGISYDKIGLKSQQHAEVLYEKSVALANHAIAPSAYNLKRPIVLTTGAERTGTGRKKMTPNDVLKMKEAFDKARFPKRGRVLVLASEHVTDLLETDEKFKEQWKDNREGRVLRMYGFDIYEELDMPVYQGTTGNATTMAKRAFGAAADATNDRIASIAYVSRNVAKAETTTEMFHSLAEDNPEYRRDVIGFRKYSVYTPLRNEGFAAIVDDKTA